MFYKYYNARSTRESDPKRAVELYGEEDQYLQRGNRPRHAWTLELPHGGVVPHRKSDPKPAGRRASDRENHIRRGRLLCGGLPSAGQRPGLRHRAVGMGDNRRGVFQGS